MDKVRLLALKIKDEIESKRSYSQIEISRTFKNRSDLSRRDKALITEIVSGSVRMQGSIDWMISNFARQPLSEIDPTQLNILRLAIYQIIYIGNIPDYAAVDEAVNQSRDKLGEGVSKFTNGLLRNFLRNKKNLKWPDKRDKVAYFSAFYSHPKWLVKKLIDDFGVDECEKVLKADNIRPNISLRVNTIKTSKDKVLEELKELGMTTKISPYASEAIIIDEGYFPLNIVDMGHVYAQDVSSMIVSLALDPIAGESVIDMCAGPGGKTTHLAQLMKNEGQIIAVDKNKKRLDTIDSLTKNLGVDIVELMAGDSSRPLNLPKADKVLVDAPCSGLGVLSRRADLRWQRKESDIDDLQNIQKRILNNSADYVKSGGKLVYSVCTFTKEETLGVVDHFLKSRDDFVVDDIGASSALDNVIVRNNQIQLMPYDENSDGMFISSFKKK